MSERARSHRCGLVGAPSHRAPTPSPPDGDREDKSLAEVLAAPVGALSGVSEADAAALQQAFLVKTVGDLDRNK